MNNSHFNRTLQYVYLQSINKCSASYKRPKQNLKSIFHLLGTNYESMPTEILIAIATFLLTDPRRQRHRTLAYYSWWQRRSTWRRRPGWGRRHPSLNQQGQTTWEWTTTWRVSTHSQLKLADGAAKTEVLREAEVFPWIFYLRFVLEFLFFQRLML